jgi:hypothetical protein
LGQLNLRLVLAHHKGGQSSAPNLRMTS